MIHVVCLNHHGAMKENAKKSLGDRWCGDQGEWAAEDPYIWGTGRGKTTVNMVLLAVILLVISKMQDIIHSTWRSGQ